MEGLKLLPVRHNSSLQVKKKKWTLSNMHSEGIVASKFVHYI